jgi:hypothetical protein
LKADAKKYRVSISMLAVLAMEAGLRVVEGHFDDLRTGVSGKRHPIKK